MPTAPTPAQRMIGDIAPKLAELTDNVLFGDILTLQWLKPDVVAQNALPGQTQSVIKLYGYPENLSGPIIETIASQLKAIESGTNCGGGAK